MAPQCVSYSIVIALVYALRAESCITLHSQLTFPRNVRAVSSICAHFTILLLQQCVTEHIQ